MAAVREGIRQQINGNRPVIYSTNHDRPVHKETVLEKAISIANLKKAAAEKYATNARKLTRRLYVKNSATEKIPFESFRPVAYSAYHEQAVHKETALEKAMNIAKLKKAAIEKYAAKKLKVEALNQKFMSNLATGKNRVESIRPGVDSTDHEQAVNEETALEIKITAQCASTKSRVSENKLTQYNRLNKCELEKHHNNIRQILNYSNATPINGHDGMGYRCCYCKNEFEEPADLKEHTLELHHDDDVSKASFMEKRMTLRGFLVKLDITALRCNECMIHIDTLDKLVEHIANLHNVTMYTGIKDLIIPFKFDSDTLTCFICLNVFYNFKMLLQHMNIHYRNYICDICGAGYINLVRLFWHRRNHDVGPFTCDYCPSVYKTIQYKREHEKVAHFGKPAKNKCGICGKKFKYHYLKVTHISEVHGVDTRTDCQVCGKTMACARKLRQHVNRTHLLYKRHRCTLCDMACYSKSELRAHMSKHDTTDERFICNDCSRPYRSRKALLNHFKHAHADQGESSIIILRTK